jgi:hypothetical protein
MNRRPINGPMGSPRQWGADGSDLLLMLLGALAALAGLLWLGAQLSALVTHRAAADGNR